ncbi:N-acetylmuramoyl-L-alanine amidase [Telmatospirillum sp. J64-1]|uniref:N-acetylmuramoyl-L-alanine amidase n=1 Tax=Telmatospirillum sp. J64-1 TaxID=2502183 RepID=UPI00115E6AB8|nr:N-acetylmuramoyl-L-alanine amidase [Telmatospirillum sp. J64-1]
MSRRVDKLVVHCSATPEGRDVSAKDIDRWHRGQGFRKIGYHYVIRLDGTIEKGRDEAEVGAHVQGHNANSIGICLIGGVSADDPKIAKDTYTPEQWTSLETLLRDLLTRYPHAEILGHRDFPGVAKACPCFDVKSWWASRQQASKPVCPTCNRLLD